MKYINVKKIVAIISAGCILISISGCRKKEEVSKSNISETNNYQYIETDPSEEVIADNSNVLDETIAENQATSLNETMEDEIITYFEDLEKELDYYINESNFEKLKEKAKNIAITGIDFIFYGKEIKGVTFEDLTTDAKEKIMYIVSSIDSKIERKIPGYKETIKDKFGQGYDYLSEKLQEGLNYIDGKLDEKYGEDYQDAKNKANEVKEEVKDGASSVYDKVSEEISEGWSKIKQWYEDKTNKG